MHKTLCDNDTAIKFEFDSQKSDTNAEKHGVDFSQAQELWSDPGLVVLPSRFPDEPRYLAIGKLRELHWTAIFTERSDRVRLISVRRSRKEEKQLYERNQ